MIWVLPVLVWLASIFGCASGDFSSSLLAYFAPSLSVFDAIFVMQAHMIGWAAGTMTSFSSLSVVLVVNYSNCRQRLFPLDGIYGLQGGWPLLVAACGQGSGFWQDQF